MKKIVAVLLALLMLALLPAALAEEDMPPTVDQLLTFCDELLTEALGQTPSAVERTEDGQYRHVYGGFALISPQEVLSAQAPVTAAELNGDPAIPDVQQISVGDSLQTLLYHYPLDNQTLAGTREEAVLYIRGILPGTVYTGWLLRSGGEVVLCEHDIYTVDGETVEKCCTVYVIEQGRVQGITLSFAVQMLSLDEAQQELDQVSFIQEAADFSGGLPDSGAVFSREDLTFGSLDFLSATPESAVAGLGQPFSDTMENGGDGLLRDMQWEGVEMVFSYTADRRLNRLEMVDVFRENVAGPRGIRVEDSLSGVLARFASPDADTAGGALYGDGHQAPYAVITSDGEYTYFSLAAQTEEGDVNLRLVFSEDRLIDMICSAE